MPSVTLIKQCGQCGKDYKVQCASRLERSKYCSKKCRLERLGRSYNYKDKTCISCSGTYTPTGPNQRFCLSCGGTESKWATVYARYGITKFDWEDMYEAQDEKCALCLSKATEIDHDHKTGRVRGLLCFSCNVALHKIDENISWANKAIEYVSLS